MMQLFFYQLRFLICALRALLFENNSCLSETFHSNDNWKLSPSTHTRIGGNEGGKGMRGRVCMCVRADSSLSLQAAGGGFVEISAQHTAYA